jgi:hypothetical protein
MIPIRFQAGDIGTVRGIMSFRRRNSAGSFSRFCVLSVRRETIAGIIGIRSSLFTALQPKRLSAMPQSGAASPFATPRFSMRAGVAERDSFFPAPPLAVIPPLYGKHGLRLFHLSFPVYI